MFLYSAQPLHFVQNPTRHNFNPTKTTTFLTKHYKKEEEIKNVGNVKNSYTLKLFIISAFLFCLLFLCRKMYKM